MRKLSILAALAAVSMAASPALANASAVSLDRAASPVDAESSQLAGSPSNWLWLAGTVAVVVGLLAVTGGEDTSTPVSP